MAVYLGSFPCDVISCFPANARHRPDVVPTLEQRRRWWPINGLTLGRCLVFAGL